MIFETVKSDVVTNKGTGLTFNSVASALKINSIGGKSVQDGTPTPDAKVDINSANVGTVRATGKNLLLYPYSESCPFTRNGITFTDNNGVITVNGKNTTTGFADLFLTRRTENTFTLPKGEYVLSGCPSGGSSTSYYIVIGNTVNGAYNKIGVDTGNGLKFTVSEENQRFSIQIAIEPNGVTYNNLVFKPMIRPATITDATYDPYKENKLTLSAPVTLSELNNIKDVICKQDNVWGVLRRVGSVVLNGSETWTATTLNRVYTSVISSTIKKPIDNKTKGNARSSHYAIRGKDYLDTGCFAIETTGALFFLDNTNGTSASTFKTWLQSNNVTVLYELAAPVFEPLPEADQNLFNSLRSYDGVTVITTDSTVEPEVCVTNAVSLTGAYALDSINALGGCKFKYENGKFYIGYDTAETEV